MAHEQQHPYHLVEPSPWPFMGAASGFVLAVGGVMYMHDLQFAVPIMVVGLALILATMFFWWRDIIREAQWQGHHTPVVQIGMRYGMALFITSEVFFFLAFFWAFFDMALYPRTGVWPPEGIQTFDPFDLPLINTLILLLSGTTVTWAHAALLQNNRKELLWGLGITVILGFLFTCLQAYEYSHAAFGFTDTVYASTFYMATGFHGFHVLVGTIFLAVCWVRAYKGHFTPEHHFGFEAAAWYWHFVDVVWLFLFICVYWWGG
ncbi:cytochrome c oxidase subunit 3 [Thalassobaculum sp. OXR-137]|uniref:cytochrome c oxidase subunit 3 n=1 Tax=Thalassobaculum sp. OXR-137 TaxID=3100173 RepID=UPI002AC9CB52|nr:cytochrome c oxidase subunit 3 [Thalassobaculum sp. OXR-137]WPZ35687.1 cytochrome c oxidase subunit 3 [Thalassobaculum sp. OXR-137]